MDRYSSKNQMLPKHLKFLNNKHRFNNNKQKEKVNNDTEHNGKNNEHNIWAPTYPVPIGNFGCQKGQKGDKGEKGDIGCEGKKGDQGDKGEKGDIGYEGKKGDQGDKGEKGDKGNKGEKGEKGDKGDKGDKGEKGEKGDKGDKGEKGAVGQSGPNNLFVNNTAFVDVQFGSDTNGEFENEAKPFATLAYALSIAPSGSVIYVRPGIYTSNTNLAKDNITWYFEPGTFVNSSVNIFDDIGESINLQVFGYGVFSIINDASLTTTALGSTIVNSTGVSNFIIEALNMIDSFGTAIFLSTIGLDATANYNIKIRNDIIDTSLTNTAIVIGSGNVQLDIVNITAGTGILIDGTNTINLNANVNTINASIDGLLLSSAGLNSLINFNGDSIIASPVAPVVTAAVIQVKNKYLGTLNAFINYAQGYQSLITNGLDMNITINRLQNNLGNAIYQFSTPTGLETTTNININELDNTGAATETNTNNAIALTTGGSLNVKINNLNNSGGANCIYLLSAIGSLNIKINNLNNPSVGSVIYSEASAFLSADINTIKSNGPIFFGINALNNFQLISNYIETFGSSYAFNISSDVNAFINVQNLITSGGVITLAGSDNELTIVTLISNYIKNTSNVPTFASSSPSTLSVLFNIIESFSSASLVNVTGNFNMTGNQILMNPLGPPQPDAVIVVGANSQNIYLDINNIVSNGTVFSINGGTVVARIGEINVSTNPNLSTPPDPVPDIIAIDQAGGYFNLNVNYFTIKNTNEPISINSIGNISGGQFIFRGMDIENILGLGFTVSTGEFVQIYADKLVTSSSAIIITGNASNITLGGIFQNLISGIADTPGVVNFVNLNNPPTLITRFNSLVLISQYPNGPTFSVTASLINNLRPIENFGIFNATLPVDPNVIFLFPNNVAISNLLQ